MKKIMNDLFTHLLKLSYLYESDLGLFAEDEFRRLIDLETRRAARCKTVSLLLLLDLSGLLGKSEEDQAIRNAASALFASTSEVDAKGWHRYPSVLGTLITDLSAADDDLCVTSRMSDPILTRVQEGLAAGLKRWELDRIGFSCYFLPFSQTSAAKVPPWLMAAQAV